MRTKTTPRGKAAKTTETVTETAAPETAAQAAPDAAQAAPDAAQAAPDAAQAAPDAAQAAPDAAQAAAKLARAIARADNAAVAAFFRAHGSDCPSVPIKARAAFGKAYRTDLAPKAYAVSARSGAAYLIAAFAHGIAPDAIDGATFPRQFVLGGIVVCVENGAASDILGNAADYDSAADTFTTRRGFLAAATAKLGSKAVAALADAIATAKLATAE